MKPPRGSASPAAQDAMPPGVATRRAAMGLLDAVLRKGLPLEAALAQATRALPRADDRALAHAIAAGALRRLPDLDALIDAETRRPLPDDAKARFALRVALVQALLLKTPPHAAIATVLPLVDGGPKRLVHGVFGTILRKATALPDPPRLPALVAERWERAWGAEMVAAARIGIAAPPPLDLALRAPDETAAWAARLGATSLIAGHLRLPAATPVTQLDGFADGAWWVQDVAASLPARLLGPGDGRTAIDLCAAPGGKTLQLAAADWAVTAVDVAAPRIVRLRENLARVRLTARVVEADAGLWTPGVPADAVLLDAPCSATGIFRRHPDVLHRVRAPAIADLAATQRRLLAHAAAMVAPGGRLVYAVCSLEREEGEDVVGDFAGSTLAQRGFAPDPVRPEELPVGIAPGEGGQVRVLPGMLAAAGGADGFFIARYRRTG